MDTKSYKEKLNAINTFIFDIDGVLTDGSVMLYKDEVVRTLNSRDSYALQYARKMGYNVFFITGGNSQPVKNRLLSLGVNEVHLGSSNKFIVYQQIKSNYGLRDEQVLYMGDDIPDYEVMRHCGIATCPQDAAVEIKAICDYQSPYNGGRHAVRDVIEQTLRTQHKWFVEETRLW